MQLKQSERKQVKLRLGLSGASGFGKTKSALLLAYGMTQDWSKIAVIDTENSSASLYSDLGNYNVLDLSVPYSPERYIQAIELCEKSGISVIIIDSITHEWSGTGGCLEIHEKLGGRFQDWSLVTPKHQAFINKILQSSCHIITTARRKVDYSLDVGSNGKTKVVKHGTKEITREGFEYELTVNFELINDKHLVKVSKDRTGLFMNQPEFIITPEIGKRILDWCNEGTSLKPGDKVTHVQKSEQHEEVTINLVRDKIQNSNSISELVGLYKQYPKYQQLLHNEYENRKHFLLQLTNPQNFSTHGKYTHTPTNS